jgi:hypothetical protein
MPSAIAEHTRTMEAKRAESPPPQPAAKRTRGKRAAATAALERCDNDA